MTVTENLIAAKKLIEKEENWTTGHYAVDDHGYDCTVLHKGATRFCSIGAVGRITGGNDCEKELAMLTKAVLEIPDGYAIHIFNDARTHAEVMAVWDRAIALSKEEAQNG